jgi:RimJ/RimL family protein N-acetyltransferase
MLGERLCLEPLRVEHADEMVRVLGAPELYRFTGGRPPEARELRERYARQVKGRSPDGREVWRNWVVRRRANGVPVGWIQATVAGSSPHRTAELAWTIGVDHQRRGYAREAAAVAMAALRAEGVTRFAAHVHPDHAASIAVARALGLVCADQVHDGEVLWRTPD